METGPGPGRGRDSLAVVMTAIMTRVANMRSLMMPACFATFSSTISVRPRVFIMTPSATLWRLLKPTSLAEMAEPKNLPPEATIRTQSRSRPAWLSMLRLTDRPVVMKKRGRRTRVVNGSILLRMLYRKGVPRPRGNTSPKVKLPIMEWKPMWWSSQADRNMPMRVHARRLLDRLPVRM